MIRTSINITKSQSDRLQALRAESKPIPTLGELIRAAIDLFLSKKQ